MMTSMMHLTQVTVSEGLDRGLKAKFKFSLPVTSELLTTTFGSLNRLRNAFNDLAVI